MAKDWKVTQTALIKGQKVTTSFILPFMDAADVSAFCSLLEGGYQVTEINEGMSDMTGSEVNAANSTPVSRISLIGENKQRGYISGFGGKPIHFKNTVNGDEIRNVLANKMVFEAVPTAKVTYVGITTGESVL
ncbi:MAG: hypothetical protein PHC64_10825 [Candidatus Gastranaerophilales bacterium]|nr:hypothetical protein [Candidatus Gastranaerophilales bacterium]